MKRITALIAIMLCVVLAGMALAADTDKTAPKQKQMMVDRNNDGVTDGVDIYGDSDNVVKRGFDADGDMYVDRWETYDENTGMPIVTESDAAFELN